jgi:tetratricopeptide (TPR) repeat protein
VQQVFSFDPYPTPHTRLTNELLQRISQGSGRLRAHTRFTLEANLMVDVQREANQPSRAIISMKQVQFHGDVIYRDFSLEKILLPNRVSLNFSVSDASGKKIFHQRLEDALVPANGGPVAAIDLPAMVLSNGLMMQLENVKFYYSEEAFDRFEGWFDALESYYAAGEKISRAMEMLDGLDYSNPDGLLLDEFRLCEAEALYGSVKQAGFHFWIELDRSDPEMVMPRMESLRQAIAPLRAGFNRSVAAIDSLFHHAGMQELDSGRVAEARELLARAVTYNPFHIPSHLAIATIDLELGAKNQAIQRMGNVLEKMYPSGSMRTQSLAVTAGILDVFFTEARELTWELRFLDALRTLEPVQAFCNQVVGFYECPAELNYRITASHMGMYRSFLTVAARAIRGDNLAFAETYINSAFEYQAAQTKYIPDAGEALEQMQMVITRHAQKGFVSMGLKDYPAAVMHLGRSRALCEQFPALQCHPGVENYYAEALRLEEAGPHAGVTPVVQTATPATRTAMQTEGARELALEKLSEGHLKAWAGEVEQARQALATVSQISLEYQLGGDTLINRRISSLSRRILEKECELARRKLHELLSRGHRFLNHGANKQAGQAGGEIMDLIEGNPRCELHAGDSLKPLIEQWHLIRYQELMDAAMEAYQRTSNGNYDDFLSLYLEAERVWHNVSHSGLLSDHQRSSRFMINSNNVPLMVAALKHMARFPEAHLPDMVMLLELMWRNEVPAVQTSEAQETVAGTLALFRNHELLRGEAHMERLYRRDQGWFNVLMETFLQQVNP